ncbi:hypothetical protein E2C01_014460 [Portunus trituberculatus]|uniref:Uncharacterized protein n=1 Tax=Portunus trituberculatus TaxID=210409 RepID=A0A5B7DK77_PORTR|nr:hypothetical protein [Portunus trituberculatus]
MSQKGEPVLLTVHQTLDSWQGLFQSPQQQVSIHLGNTWDLSSCNISSDKNAQSWPKTEARRKVVVVGGRRCHVQGTAARRSLSLHDPPTYPHHMPNTTHYSSQ